MNRVSLAVSGMSCAGCEQRISAVPQRLNGVAHVAADHQNGTVVVDHDPAAVDEATIIRRVAAAGYGPVETGVGR
ncbi:MAG: heavy-metal-associated domain-containing protein [Acidimicrobiales bacterium]